MQFTMDKIMVRLDLDDVLNELSTHWADEHHDSTGERLELTHWDVHTLSVHGEAVYDYFNHNDFFYNCPMKEGARKTIDILEKSPHVFDYKIVSSCQQEESAFEHINQQKLSWCKENLGDTAMMNFILVGKDKSEFKGDVIVDDKPENITNQGIDNTSLRILFTAPHNSELSIEELEAMDSDANAHFVRVNNHKQLQDILYEILKAQSLENYLENV